MFTKIGKYSLIPMVVFIMAFSVAAFADTSAEAVSDDNKEEVQEVARVEVTGSRLAEDIREVPAPAYVITKEEIEMSGARSTRKSSTGSPESTASGTVLLLLLTRV